MMLSMIGFFIFITLLAYFQIRQFVEKEGKKEAIVYGLFMSLAALMGALLIAGVKIPSHNVLVIKFFEPLGKFILGK